MIIMSDEYQKRVKEMEIARRNFGSLVQKFEKDFGLNSYLNRAPKIEDSNKLGNAILLSDRYQLLSRLPKNSNYIEVGVDKGDFSKSIIKNCNPSKLILIDADTSRISTKNMNLFKSNESVEIIQGYSDKVLARLTGNYECIYIDGDHSYNQVCIDIDCAKDLVSVGGFLVFNDYTLWSPANMMNYGVSRAVNEFLNRSNDWEVAFFAFQGGGYHDIALRRLNQ